MRASAATVTERAVAAGSPVPLGVTLTAEGINVAVFSERAEAIDVCLFDRSGRYELERIRLPERTGDVLHGWIGGIGAGSLYGLRAYGPWAPERGERFNPACLLLDPYARALVGRFTHLPWPPPRDSDLVLDPRDTAPRMPRCVVAAGPVSQPPLDPAIPAGHEVIYEAHVKGLTALHPGVPAQSRGRYAALAEPAVLDHLLRLGITSLELLPVTAFVDEPHLVERGLVNYWGYNSAAFLATEPRYSVVDAEAELARAISALHAAGIEVILDVVYNHTAESDEYGPTLSFRGLDNASYYRLRPDEPRRYVNHAGTGNVLNLAHPRVLQLVMDSLRHWAGLGVDGFRFDLGVTLGRDAADRFDLRSTFFQAVAQDPLLSRRKMIAEPWDVGPEGYRAGGFPPTFREWNDRFRDGVRRFWRGDEAILPDLASRLLASADRFDHAGKRPWVSVNYVASHDGAPLADLVAFTRKRNEANGEGNRDGHHDELGSNGGVEGPSDDRDVLRLRRLRRRAMLATVLLAQGTPMLAMGDELGRSQQGNTNAYCQDNAINWLDWTRPDPDDAGLLELVARLTALRRGFPALRDDRFRHGGMARWYREDATPMQPGDWHDPTRRSVVLVLPADQRTGTLALALNAGTTDLQVSLPVGGPWSTLVDTAESAPTFRPATSTPDGRFILRGPALRLLVDDGSTTG